RSRAIARLSGKQAESQPRRLGIRIQLRGVLVVALRFFHLSQGLALASSEQLCKVKVLSREFGICSPGQFSDRLFVSPELAQRLSQSSVCFGVIGRELQALPQEMLGTLELRAPRPTRRVPAVRSQLFSGSLNRWRSKHLMQVGSIQREDRFVGKQLLGSVQ